MLKIGIKLPAYNLDTNIDNMHESLSMLHDLGFCGIEFTPDNFDLLEYGTIDKANLITLKTILEKYSFEKVIHIPLRCNLFNQQYFEIHKKVLFATCELCSELNAKTLVFHPGRSHDNVDFSRFGKPQRSHTFSRELIERECVTIQEAADKYSEVIIAMENHRPYADYSPYSYAEFCGELANVVNCIGRRNVRVTLDTGHLNLSGSFHNLDINNELMAIKNLITHCHIHDNHGITNFYTDKDKSAMLPFGLGDEHTIPGRGTFPFNDFFRAMKGYSYIYTIELTARYFNKKKIMEAYHNVASFLENANKD